MVAHASVQHPGSDGRVDTEFGGNLGYSVIPSQNQKAQLSALYALIIHDSIGARKSQKPGFYLLLNVFS